MDVPSTAPGDAARLKRPRGSTAKRFAALYMLLLHHDAPRDRAKVRREKPWVRKRASEVAHSAHLRSSSRSRLGSPGGRAGRDQGVGRRAHDGARTITRPALGGGPLTVLHRLEGDGHVVTPIGDLDCHSVALLEEAVCACSAADGPSITLDLRRLTFIDSSGLWTITSAKRWCDRQARCFTLVPGPAPIQRIFEVTGLSDVLPFRATSHI
jgi:anti-sigma B factor antagonist